MLNPMAMMGPVAQLMPLMEQLKATPGRWAKMKLLKQLGIQSGAAYVQSTTAEARTFLAILKEANIKLSGPNADIITLTKQGKSKKTISYRVSHNGELLMLEKGRKKIIISPDEVLLDGRLRNLIRHLIPATQADKVLEKLFKTKAIQLFKQEKYSELETMYANLTTVYEQKLSNVLKQMKALKKPSVLEKRDVFDATMTDMLNKLNGIKEKIQDYSEKAAFYKAYPEKLKAK